MVLYGLSGGPKPVRVVGEAVAEDVRESLLLLTMLLTFLSKIWTLDSIMMRTDNSSISLLVESVLLVLCPF